MFTACFVSTVRALCFLVRSLFTVYRTRVDRRALAITFSAVNTGRAQFAEPAQLDQRHYWVRAITFSAVNTGRAFAALAVNTGRALAALAVIAARCRGSCTLGVYRLLLES